MTLKEGIIDTIGAGISGLIGWGIGKAVDGQTKLVHASQFKMSPKLWTKLESFLFDISDDGLKIAAQWKDFLKADYIIGLVKRFGRETVASILNKIAGTIESNILCDIL